MVATPPCRMAFRFASVLRIATLSALAIWACHGSPGHAAAAARPNIVVFFVDNLGNGDIGCNGSTLHRTPRIDRLAAEGARLTSFYSASGVCTPSRAALLTGCYPRRLNMHDFRDGGLVLQPVAATGLNPCETTIAEVLGSVGYVSGIFGKWHLGDQPEFLPTRQGFTEFYGIPYSDDMTPRPNKPWPPLPLMRNETVIEAPVDRNLLSKQCTEAAVDFIERHRERPFFLYLPHPMPGSTNAPFASEAFRGQSKNGPYGDSVEELDWATGRILDALERHGLDANTLVIWTSDNGAVRHDPPQGSCAPYRGFGYDSSEGSMRMPCLVRWPGRVPPGGVIDAVCSTMDLLPTFARVAGAELPAFPIDGHDITDILAGTAGTSSPWDDEGLGFYMRGELQAIRAGAWKLYLRGLPLPKNSPASTPQAPARPALFDVRTDVAETSEVSARHPDVVARLERMAEALRGTIGDIDRPGSGQRAAGYVADPRPVVMAK